MMVGLGLSHSNTQLQTHTMLSLFSFLPLDQSRSNRNCVAKVIVLLDMWKMGLGIGVAHDIIH